MPLLCRKIKPTPTDRLYPGPQTESHQLLSPIRLLYLVIAATTVLFFQALIHDNLAILSLPLFSVHGVNLWALQIFDTKSAATVMIGLVSLAFVSRQVTLGYRPFFNYKCGQTRLTAYALDVAQNGNGTYWSVVLQNVGAGPAVVRHSSYRVCFDRKAFGRYGEYETAINDLSDKGFVNGHDYIVTYLSNGWSLAAKSEFTIVELALAKAHDLFALDIMVEFEGLLGDRYIKEIYCIPRRGIYPSNPHAQNVPAKGR